MTNLRIPGQNFLNVPQIRSDVGLATLIEAISNINRLIAYVSPKLFAYAFCTALLLHVDANDDATTSVIELFLQRLTRNPDFGQYMEKPNIFHSRRLAIEIIPALTGYDLDGEYRLAYFREDIGINLNHWHWHLFYRLDGPNDIVKKDRRGELFYYLHQQILVRYNIERLCHQMNMTRSLADWTEPLKEAYFPMLDTPAASRKWPGRPANLKLSDIDRSDVEINFELNDLRRWKQAIRLAIHKSRAKTVNGGEIRLDNIGGINILGNMIQASYLLSPNYEYYGNLHNAGHVAIAYIHDPQGTFNKPSAVMHTTTTAMRDPIFYRWHEFINDLFLEHKNSFSPYTLNDLNWTGGKIYLTSLEVCSDDDGTVDCTEKNVLRTFMMQNDVYMSRGLDFSSHKPILARITHLNHKSFVYKFEIYNALKTKRAATIRIFMAPRKNNNNNVMSFEKQKNLMIEMDKYVVTLDIGWNNLTRRSVDSSLTIPFEQTFRNLNYNRPEDDEYEKMDLFNYCGCGWPQHMLIPKGHAKGYPMQLFMVVTDYEQDKVYGSVVPSSPQPGSCKPSPSFCGLPNSKYPDKRPLGFPFDRPLESNVESFEDFKGPMTNMVVRDITIIHSDVVQRGNLVTNNTISIRDLVNSRHAQ